MNQLALVKSWTPELHHGYIILYPRTFVHPFDQGYSWLLSFPWQGTHQTTCGQTRVDLLKWGCLGHVNVS